MELGADAYITQVYDIDMHLVFVIETNGKKTATISFSISLDPLCKLSELSV